MASPGNMSDNGIFQSSIRRIPTPLGPTHVPESGGGRVRSPSQTSVNVSPTAVGPPPESPDDENEAQEPPTGGGTVLSKLRTLSRRQVFTLCAVCSANICSAVFYSLLAPFFPTEALQQGATSTEVGIILGVFQGIVFISSPFFGNYMTTIGPKFMFVAGTLTTSTCVILFGLLERCPPGTIYVVMCISVRSVEALAAAATTTASQTIAAHTFSSNVSTIMGILQSCGCLGLMMGPPIGGALYSLGGFGLPFFVSGGLFFAGGIASLLLLPPQTVEPKPYRGSRFAVLRIPIISVVGLMAAVGQFAMGFIDVGLATYLTKYHLHPAIVGLLFLIAPVIVVVLAPIVGCITDRVQWLGRPLMVGGLLIGGLGFLVLGPTPLFTFLPSDQLWTPIAALCVAGFGWSSMVTCYPEYVLAARHHGFPDSMETQGLLSGVFNAFNSLGALLGPTVGGVLLEKLHFPWASTVVAGLAFLSSALMILYCLAEVTCCRQYRYHDNQASLITESES